MIQRLLFFLFIFFSFPSFAVLTIDITEGIEGAAPVAVVPFSASGTAAPEDIAAIIQNDLRRSGRFTLLAFDLLPERPSSSQQVNFQSWRNQGVSHLVIGRVKGMGENYTLEFELFDALNGNQMLAQSLSSTRANLRRTAHRISDLIYQALTGEAGAFNTRLAFVTVTGSGKKKTYRLQIADADGAAARTILTSREPILSPAWSPDGESLAYVSLENKRTAVYIQDLRSGQRRQVAAWRGLNTAPAWSPDGKNIVFTSDRGGTPQIYKVPIGGGEAQRLTFEGKYNARPSYSPDGKSLVFVNGSGGFRVGVLNLENRQMNVLSNTTLDESPTFAPNGSMLIYASGKELSAVSIDGRVRQRLAVEAGTEVREPAWSPLNR